MLIEQVKVIGVGGVHVNNATAICMMYIKNNVPSGNGAGIGNKWFNIKPGECCDRFEQHN